MTRGLDGVVMAQIFLCLLYPFPATRQRSIAAKCRKAGEGSAPLRKAKALQQGRTPARTRLERRHVTIACSPILGGDARQKCQANLQIQVGAPRFASGQAISPRRLCAIRGDAVLKHSRPHRRHDPHRCKAAWQCPRPPLSRSRPLPHPPGSADRTWCRAGCSP